MNKFLSTLALMGSSHVFAATLAGQPRQISTVDIKKYFEPTEKTAEWKEKKAQMNFCFSTTGIIGKSSFSFQAEMNLKPEKAAKCHSIEITNVRDESEGYYTYFQDPFKFLGQTSKIITDRAYLLSDNLRWYAMFVGEWGSSISEAISVSVYRLNPIFDPKTGFKLSPDLACSAFAYQAPDGDCFECELQTLKGLKASANTTGTLLKITDINPNIVSWSKDHKNCSLDLRSNK